ncbi:mechanosensitive ion channel domain-containing protein [Okeania sp. SIO1F9]|uniref:mechanosensitive ion channel domain-containing protein n=2 Tax=unclassified Okeania TaxID=2634635 RepID=UPI00144D8E32|nr:mechanosensitive ion channel domain-containing protein [Okeania sp. SIO1F9]NET77606.1 mechanosensitive ion channel [Okeania sp. SIO1F9]
MNWILIEIKNIFRLLVKIVIFEIFELGNKSFSIKNITEIIFLIVLVVFFSRTIKNWMKEWILVNLGIKKGTREAIASIINYIITITGILIVLHNAGIDLTSITVIAGALSIGIGIGLKNIISNFVSGLTILIAQPIKVGDFIKVDDLSGVVEKTSIRSTIIRTIDGIFVIVPNNFLVEQNIINWSHKDSTSRLRIPIGVAYGSDTILVTEALLDAARKEKRVLSNPSPKVWFKGFGDSALNFELLVWIKYPPLTDPIKSSLNFSIDSELRSRNISIPFPQRDLHIRQINDLIPTHQKAELTTVGKNQKNFSNSLIKNQVKTKQNFSKWNLRDLLRQISYFKNCNNIEIRDVIENGYRKIVPRGEIICLEGESGDSFYIILSGSVEVFSEKANKYITTRYAGEFIGEMSLILGITRTASLRATEDTILFVVDRDNLHNLLAKHQRLADKISEELSRRLETLKNLGLLDKQENSQETAMIWIRNRIYTLFGI